MQPCGGVTAIVDPCRDLCQVTRKEPFRKSLHGGAQRFLNFPHLRFALRANRGRHGFRKGPAWAALLRHDERVVFHLVLCIPGSSTEVRRMKPRAVNLCRLSILLAAVQHFVVFFGPSCVWRLRHKNRCARRYHKTGETGP